MHLQIMDRPSPSGTGDTCAVSSLYIAIPDLLATASVWCYSDVTFSDVVNVILDICVKQPAFCFRTGNYSACPVAESAHMF
jgi:hypothetical protein